MRPLPQAPELEEGREPLHRQTTSGHETRFLHRDSSQQLPSQEGGRRRRGLHPRRLQRRQDGGGQARNEEEVIFCWTHFFLSPRTRIRTEDQRWDSGSPGHLLIRFACHLKFRFSNIIWLWWWQCLQVLSFFISFKSFSLHWVVACLSLFSYFSAFYVSFWLFFHLFLQLLFPF